MQRFYLYRHEDLHGHSGLGTVAQGVIFDNGLVAMTWLSEWGTVTMFQNIKHVQRLHSHEGRTVIVLEGRKKDAKQFSQCQDDVRTRKAKRRHEESQKDTEERDVSE